MDYNLNVFMSIESILIDYNPLKMDYNPNIFMPTKSIIMDFFESLIMKFANLSKISHFLFSAVTMYHVS